MAFIILFAFYLLLRVALGVDLVCEHLPTDLCSYSISSSGKRCTLENFATAEGTTKYQCRTSEVVVDTMKDWIESDKCISACGVDRNTVGISSDDLLLPYFLVKLCSNPCYLICPNIVDLYHNLALAEGNYLPRICDNPHRALYETKSSGEIDPSPVHGGALFAATSPAPSPEPAWAPSPST